MSSSNNPPPEQEYNKILEKAALNIKRLEQQRDAPQRPGGPAPRLAPKGAPPPVNRGHNDQARKDSFNDRIANEKANAIKQTDQVIGKMPPEARKGMQAKALNRMYPENKNDLNQMSPKGKALDNAQERFNDKRAQQMRKEQAGQPSRFSQSLNPRQQQQKDQFNAQTKSAKNNQAPQKNTQQKEPEGKRNEQIKSAKENGKDVTNRQPDQQSARNEKMNAAKQNGKDITQPSGSSGAGSGAKKNPNGPDKGPGPGNGAGASGGAKANSNGKIGSMGTRFTQSLGPSTPGGGSSPSKSSPSKSSPGGGRSGGPGKD